MKWHDPEEAIKILQDTLILISKNLKTAINNELKNTLEFQKKIIFNNERDRLNYLQEQTFIAKELDILNNQIDNVNLSAYYLRGYKAIDKEIELIKNRDYESLKYSEQEIDALKDLEINYVDYNVYLIETKSLKNTKFILMISVLLGLIIGVSFVLISSAFQYQSASKKN